MEQISDVLRILANVRTVSQALEQRRERLKLSEYNNAVDVGKVFTKTFQKFQK